MEEREKNLKYIIATMTSLGLNPPIFSTEYPEIDFIIDSYMQCINMILRDQKSKQELYDTIQRQQVAYKEVSQVLENNENKIHGLECEISRLTSQISTNNLKFKAEKDKICMERDMAKKESAKFSSLCTQHSHEAKKHENAFIKLQEHLSKNTGLKENSVKNTIETSSLLHKEGVNIENHRGDEELIHFIRQGYHKNVEYLTNVINALIFSTDLCFESMQNVMEKVGNAPEWEKILLENPETYRNQVDSRIKSFAAAMKDVDKVKEDSDFPSQTVPYLKESTKSYKEIISSNILYLIKDDKP